MQAQRTTDPAADEEHRLGDSRLMCKAFSIGVTLLQLVSACSRHILLAVAIDDL